MTYPPHEPPAAPRPDTPTQPLPRRGSPRTAVPARAPFMDPQVPQVRQKDELAERYELVRRLGLPTAADPVFDDFAREMADRTGFLYGFVNLLLSEQTFIGLHQPPAGSGYVIVGRTMSIEYGWCPEVVDRKKALPLPDVHASPRFSGNYIVDAVGIQSYFGAPLIYRSIVLGTVCVIDPDKRPHSEARRFRDLVIDTGREVMHHVTHELGR